MKTVSHYLKCVLILGFTFTLVSLSAQTEAVSNKRKDFYGGFGHLSFSGEQLNLSHLNSSFSSVNYGKVSLYSSSFGGGGLYVLKNFLVGGSGAWLMRASTQNSVNSVDLKGGYGFFNFGYLLHTGKRSLWYPAIGIGGGSYDIIISRKDVPADFNQQLNNPNGTVVMETGGWMANLQLTYQYFLGKNTEGLLIGLKAGYRYSPNDWKTSTYSTTLSNSPKINMNGFYVTLILGAGSVFPNPHQ